MLSRPGIPAEPNVTSFIDVELAMGLSQVSYYVTTKLSLDKGWINFFVALLHFTLYAPFLPSGAYAFAKGFNGVVLPINVNAAD
ncbi:hypothetical protein CCUS01_15528 [Colletotrichum cuscutae]|uniref:Uncharacterized protein n=1 Tax=Colletotrichum cuscutae TaxID=1209917 RepID=A0AAI9VH28_9PEZI|nr:hypothetical protein CCUS01_15528 [Colletotrichum cuscutae]